MAWAPCCAARARRGRAIGRMGRLVLALVFLAVGSAFLLTVLGLLAHHEPSAPPRAATRAEPSWGAAGGSHRSRRRGDTARADGTVATLLYVKYMRVRKKIGKWRSRAPAPGPAPPSFWVSWRGINTPSGADLLVWHGSGPIAPPFFPYEAETLRKWDRRCQLSAQGRAGQESAAQPCGPSGASPVQHYT